MYLVKYCGGSYEDHYIRVLFVTAKKSTATKYVTKFNKILKKWTNYYKQYESDDHYSSWIKDEHAEKYFDRWWQLRNITRCYWDEIEVR